ncbi:hypothetical protein Q5H92_20530 [Hymenobacter sp. M29]|uniref:Uncharacterized protein n=1 Tax=Hymenobacter mellowenesis TaxID=3063995 RepID=A0ABT9AHF7_9BACT|nr:hypothetical protein [Hymenobacter sp. M29]MDO7848764.1 hypothetical protein [Hymenobacter sp. M29]
MKQDIPFDPVEGVSVAVIPDEQALTPEGQPFWQVYLLNHNAFPLENVIINAKGYGEQPDGEKVQTSTLRYLFEEVPAHTAVPVESIDPAVFHLNNQYWVSYYRGAQIFDKKFVFVPDSIVPDNLIHIALLNRQGVLHS